MTVASHAIRVKIIRSIKLVHNCTLFLVCMLVCSTNIFTDNFGLEKDDSCILKYSMQNDTPNERKIRVLYFAFKI